MTEKVRGRSRKRKYNSVRRVTDKLKRCAVWLVCISLIGTSIPMSMILASAEDEEDDIVSECEIFSLSLDSLIESTEKAVTDEEPLSEEIYEFSGSNAERYEKLFDTKDGLLYEIRPELDEEGEDLTLRTFVRIKNSGLEEVSDETDENEDDPLSYYNVTGDEEIISLLINDTDSEVSARVQVSTDEETYETQLIKVPGYHESITLDETTLTTPLEYVTVDEKEENVQTAALRIESGSNAYWEGEEEPKDETEAEAEAGAGDEAGSEETAEAEGETQTEAQDTEETVGQAESGGSLAAGTTGGSTVVIEAAETASNALANASAHSEGCVSMHGTLYDAVTVDGEHAVAFSTTFADLGYKTDDTEWITYTAYADGVAVTVKLPAGAVPEGAELSVMRHDEESSEYTEALSLINEYKNDLSKYEQAVTALSSKDNDRESESSFTFSLGDEDETESGMISLDISFLIDGEEIEPEAEASVKIDASEALNESEGEVESIEVWHMEETEDGTEPVLVAAVRDSNEAADGVAEFTVDSFSEFEFHYTCSVQGWAGFGANLIDENGDTISATVTGYDSALTGGRYTTTVDMPYTFTIEEFVEHFTTSGAYDFLYATVTDPNYGDEDHTFDVWPDENEVGANELYGSKENPVVSVTIDGTAATENPNYGTGITINSKTWHFTLTYEGGESVTIPIYGNADGANDNGGKYCPKYLEINLYYKGAKEAVLNLGNGNGTYSDGDYTGSNGSSGEALRYGTGALDDYADNERVTINLPSDDDLDKEFTVVDSVGTEGEDGYLPEITIALGKEEAYDYKLVGWINIATGEYYDVSNGSTTAEIDLSNNNVFYADWIGADYDRGSASDENLRDTVSTSSFVKFRLFDYNELFNLYSVALTQNGTRTESWADSGSLYSEPLLGNTDLTPISRSFIFQNNGTTRSNTHVLSHANPQRWNLWTANGTWTGEPEYNFVLDAKEYWNITRPDSTILGMLYDTEENSLGVHYVGEGDYLFWIDENGYYTYNSAESGAAYNQSEGRFYVYEDAKNSFFPYNEHTETMTSSNGMINYWFGMNMEVEFYLPSNTANGTETHRVNQVDGKDMTFDFSGDDDIMIFIDDKMVVDMSGIHSTSYSRINFSTNTVTYSMSRDADGAPDTTSETVKHYVDDNLNLSAGYHTLKVFYMERGASASNLKIQFNIPSAWEYENGPVQTLTVKKEWYVEDDQLMEDVSAQSAVEIGLFDTLQVKSSDSFGYERDGDLYTVEYMDDDEVTHKYVYDASGPSLTYTEGVTTTIYDNTNSSGKVIDDDGYVIAWLDGVDLHIRIDRKTLDYGNEWGDAWELLDPGGDYEILELTESKFYTARTTSQELTTHEYWSIIGDPEIEDSISDGDLQVILTEAAQEADKTIGNTSEAKGYVIVAEEKNGEYGITTEQVKFSQIATLESETLPDGNINYKGTYGVTSQSEINGLGEGAVWYVEDANERYEGEGLSLEEFYLYCMLNEERYYLSYLDDANGEYLTVSTNEEVKATFYYDNLGELMIYIAGDENDPEEQGHTVRVEIMDDGTITFGSAEDKAAVDDVRVYTLSDVVTTGTAFTAGNYLTLFVKGVDTDNDNIFDDDGESVNVGDILTYEISYYNFSDTAATITITDEIDTGLDFESASDGGTYNEAARTITWVIEDVPSLDEGSVTFTATVNDSALTEVENTATGTVSNKSYTTNKVTNPIRQYYPIEEEIVPDHDDRSTWVKNESVNEYNAIEIEMSTLLPRINVDVINEGSFSMNFHEVLDSELVLDELDKDFSVYIGGNQIDHKYYTVMLTSGLATLASGDTVITDGCTFHVDVDLTALYKDGVINESNLQGNTEIIIYFFADLEGTGLNGSYKSTVWYDVYDGDTWEYTSNEDVVYVYTYEIEILKYDASGFTGGNYSDHALAGATLGLYYDESTGNAVSRNGSPYTGTSGSDGKVTFYGLAAGTYYIKEITAPEGYTVSDDVLTIELGEDLNSRGYIYEGRFANWQTPAKAVDTDGDGSYDDDRVNVRVGDTLEYKIYYENTYGETADITITDELDESLDYVDESAGKYATYDKETRTITWVISNVPANVSGSVTFVAIVNENALVEEQDDHGYTTVSNTATVQAGDHSPQQTNTVENPVESKSVDANDDGVSDDNGSDVKVGDTLVYKIYYKNTEDSTETITITDVLESGLTFVSATDGGTYNSSTRTVTWEIEASAGEYGSVELTVRVNSTGHSNGSVSNTGSVRVGNNTRSTNSVENPVQGTNTVTTSSGGGGGYSGSGSGHSNSSTSGPGAENTAHESSGGGDSSGGNSVGTDSIGGLPQTGEGNTAMILIVVCVVFAAVLAILFYIRRRTPKNED